MESTRLSRPSPEKKPELRRSLRSTGSKIALCVVVALGCALRLPALGWLPAPNGDEGNWAMFAAQIRNGTFDGLPAAYRANSPAFAYLLAAITHAIGASWVGLRLAGALAPLVAASFCYSLLRSIGLQRAGLTIAAVLALHPWSVIWSRTAAVPYALTLSLMTTGSVAFFVGLTRRSPRLVAGAIVMVGLSAHLSPLAIVVVPPCAWLALQRDQRWVLRDPVILSAGLCVAALTIPIVIWMGQADLTGSPKPPDLSMSEQIRSLLHMLVTGPTGEATLRHFTNHALSLSTSAAYSTLTLSALVLHTAWKTRREHGELAPFGLVSLASGCVLLPLSLARGRPWYLPDLDAERYVFVVLPGLAFCLASVAEGTVYTIRRNTILGLWSVILLTASLRLLVPLAFGHGVFRGGVIAEGGECYLGWLTTKNHKAPSQIVARIAKKQKAVAVLYDGYGFHVLKFLLMQQPVVVASYGERKLWKDLRGRFVFVVWANEAGSVRGFSQRNEGRRNLLKGRGFSDTRLETKVAQPDGTPLFEVWSARH